MAFEDAAELAAYVQEYGVSKEALRRYDVARRPRWRHVMQLTAAQGASTTTGVAISSGFLKYTADLYQREFQPLGKDAARRGLGGGEGAGGREQAGVVAGVLRAVWRTALTGAFVLAAVFVLIC
jgi:hypothetical protein